MAYLTYSGRLSPPPIRRCNTNPLASPRGWRRVSASSLVSVVAMRRDVAPRREDDSVEQYLFAKDDLRSALAANVAKVARRLQEWNHDALLNAPEADVADDLINEATVECPRLLRDEAWMPPPSEILQTVNQLGWTGQRHVMRFHLVVPFSGEAQVFKLRASTSSWNPPTVSSLAQNELTIAVDGPASDAAQVRGQFDQQLEKIERHLEWSRLQIEQHNDQIHREIPGLVSRRRTELLAARNLQADIGFPIRRRPDADTYAVPIKRRTLRTAPRVSAPTATFRPEPAMADRDYEAALDVLRNSRNALERSPSMAEKLSEEQIRDLLLVSLNATFEGDAAGEVFNGAGKTDILIRVGDRNVFIGECKIWGGPATMDEALDQIFRYLVWRDTKAAILLFIRNKDVTAIIKKAVAKIETNLNYKRRGRSYDDDRLDFVMHAEDDLDREIHLALLPFALRSQARW